MPLSVKAFSVLGSVGGLVLVAVIGCSAHHSASVQDHGGGGGISLAGSVSDLQGSWSSGCRDPKENGLGESVTVTLEGTSFTRVARVSPRGDCSNPYIEAIFKGSFLTREQVREGVYGMDLTVSSATVKVLNSAGAEILNLAKSCGMRWRSGQEHDVLEQIGNESCFARYPRRQFEVYKLEDSKLFFGLGENLAAPEKRPVEVERLKYFARQ